MKRAVKTLTCLALVAPTFVQAQIVMCTDEKGRTYTSDRPIPECQGRAMRHYGKTGTVVREIPAPLTAEENRQQQLEAQKQREIERAEQEQRRQDRALLAAYRNEGALLTAREQAASPVYEMIKYEKTVLDKAKERRDAALARLKSQGKDPQAPEWKRRADESDSMAKKSAAKLQEYEAELTLLRDNYDAKLKRYRELKGIEASVAQKP